MSILMKKFDFISLFFTTFTYPRIVSPEAQLKRDLAVAAVMFTVLATHTVLGKLLNYTTRNN